MNLYLVSQNENDGYDTFDSFICAAESEQNAREIHPFGYQDKDCDEYSEEDDNWFYDDTWVSKDKIGKVKVKQIGVADPSIPKGVILASFNAG